MHNLLIDFKRPIAGYIDTTEFTELTFDGKPLWDKLGNWVRLSCECAFSLSMSKGKTWLGELGYSFDGSTWQEWDGTSIHNDMIYLKGVSNTSICGRNGNSFVMVPDVAEKTVAAEGTVDYLIGNSYYSENATYKFYQLFKGTPIDTAPQINLTKANFYDCSEMFMNCTSLLDTAEMPYLVTIDMHGCEGMYEGCSNLIHLQRFEPERVNQRGCKQMFRHCTSLTESMAIAPTGYAYEEAFCEMFNGCTSLTKAGEIDLTEAEVSGLSTLYMMFKGCNSLETPPKISLAATTQQMCEYMFYECQNLNTLPKLGAGTISATAYRYMFKNCPHIKVSETQTEEYQYAFRIPTEGTGTAGTSALKDMFVGTGGTFTGTPEVNTTYYTDHEPV